jgi:hypothetical protein
LSWRDVGAAGYRIPVSARSGMRWACTPARLQHLLRRSRCDAAARRVVLVQPEPTNARPARKVAERRGHRRE